MIDIAVLGCGPAGMLAAHAVVTHGAQLTIYSDRMTQSKIGGAQFLHVPIPGITTTAPDGYVEFHKWGTAEGYAENVYNDPDAVTSWGAYPPGEAAVWNMQQAYDNLWERYSDRIVQDHVDPEFTQTLVRSYDLVLSCIPAPAICPHRTEDGSPACDFSSQPVWIQNEAQIDDMSIVYNGRLDGPGWYRSSKIFGHGFREYSFFQPSATRIVKPLRTTCSGYPGVVRLGRYGAWEKRLLIHDAYYGAIHAMQSV